MADKHDATRRGSDKLTPGLPDDSETTPDPFPSANETVAMASDGPRPDRVGNFAIERLLGSGGFGHVYLARDENLGRSVALKFLTDTVDAHHRRLFEREARAIAKLSKHPHIVEIHSWGEYDGTCYFVLEYVANSLEKLLREYPNGMPMSVALSVAQQCADALGFAQENGVVHRDIKPGNILLETRSGPAKIADFGLTRLVDSPEDSLISGVSGSPPYMSPEQAAGLPLDHRTDIFSLGVTLYEMLCGARLFEAGTAAEYIDRIQQDMRTPLSDRGDFPNAVLRIVDKATAHDRTERYQSGREMAADLEKALKVLETQEVSTIKTLPPRQAKPSPERWMKPGVLVACGALILMAIFGLVLGSFGRQGAPENLKFASAAVLFNNSDFSGAESMYRSILEKDPKNGRAAYGMGYALLKQSQPEAAKRYFDAVDEEPLRQETGMALEYATSGVEGVSNALSPAAATPYAQTILAKADNAAGDHEAALEAAKAAAEGDFPFEWQRGECLAEIGKAYYHLGEFAEAARTLASLEQGSGANHASAAAYLRLARARIDGEKRARVMERAKELSTLLAEKPELADEADQDTWTSRPLPFVILPTQPEDYAALPDQGLGEVLPILIADELSMEKRLQLVDREIVHEVLCEQELSGRLGSNAVQLQLGRLLGARLMMRCEFYKTASEWFAKLRIVDVETTRVLPSKHIDLGENPGTAEIAGAIADAAKWSIHETYPLRAEVVRGDGGQLTLNIGSEVGIEPGMQLSVAPRPDDNLRIENAKLIVQKPVASNSAPVTGDGFDMAQFPAEGLYAFQTTD